MPSSVLSSDLSTMTSDAKDNVLRVSYIWGSNLRVRIYIHTTFASIDKSAMAFEILLRQLIDFYIGIGGETVKSWRRTLMWWGTRIRPEFSLRVPGQPDLNQLLTVFLPYHQNRPYFVPHQPLPPKPLVFSKNPDSLQFLGFAFLLANVVVFNHIASGPKCTTKQVHRPTS